MDNNFKVVENGIVSIYENEEGERLINARELHEVLENKRQFANWIKQRIEHYKFIENKDFVRFNNFVKGDKNGYGNKTIIEYYLTLDMTKELCMVENNDIGRKIRRYFIELEKRYRSIIEKPQNVFDVMRLALDQIEENEKKLKLLESETKNNKKEISKNTNEIEEIKQSIKGTKRALINLNKDTYEGKCGSVYVDTESPVYQALKLTPITELEYII